MYFWNQHKVNGIDLTKATVPSHHSPDQLINFNHNALPKCVIKYTLKSIQPRGLKSPHLVCRSFDLLHYDPSFQRLVHVVSDNQGNAVHNRSPLPVPRGFEEIHKVVFDQVPNLPQVLLPSLILIRLCRVD